MRFTHIINPFPAKAGSEHERAQRVTRAALQRAVAYAAGHGIEARVAVVAAPDEQGDFVGEPFISAPSLTRDIRDIAALEPRRPLPLIGDIVRSGHAVARDGDWLIFTNIDIHVQPDFYVALAALIRSSDDPERAAFAVNRRTIGNDYAGPGQLDAMIDDAGQPHIGWDCFVFPMSFVPRMELGTCCIGSMAFDNLLLINMDVLSGGRGRVLQDVLLTFHIGDDQGWFGQGDYVLHNGREAMKAVARLVKREGRYPDTGIGAEHHQRVRDKFWAAVGRKDAAVNWWIEQVVARGAPVPREDITDMPRDGGVAACWPAQLLEALRPGTERATREAVVRRCANADALPKREQGGPHADV